MELSLLKCKLHRVRVTDIHQDYEGSCAIDEDLLDASGIHVFEQVHIWNVTSGERFVTYAIRAERGSGIISINGAAAHKADVGDIVIIAAFANLSEDDVRHFAPKLIYVNDENQIVLTGHEIPRQAA